LAESGNVWLGPSKAQVEPQKATEWVGLILLATFRALAGDAAVAELGDPNENPDFFRKTRVPITTGAYKGVNKFVESGKTNESCSQNTTVI